MSTIMYLRCVTHDPYIGSDKVGHNTSYLKQIREDIAKRDEIVQSMRLLLSDPVAPWPDNTTWWFLYRHPKCMIEIWDEYGKQYSLLDDSDKPIEKVVYQSDLAREHNEALMTRDCPVCGIKAGVACGPGGSLHIKRIWKDWK